MTTPIVYLACRIIHPNLLPLILRLGLPVVGLTKESRELLKDVPQASIRPVSPSKINSNDILIATLRPDNTDVYLHSLIRSCCQRSCFVLTRPQDYTTFDLTNTNKNDLIAAALRYCSAFDALLSNKVSTRNKSETTLLTKSSFSFSEPSSDVANALKPYVQVENVEEGDENRINYSVGNSKSDDVGPSADAISIATKIAPDHDAYGSVWDFAFLFFCDGETIIPSNQDDVLPVFSWITSRSSLDDSIPAREAALNSATRVMESCAFVDSHYRGPIILRVSSHGKVVEAVFSDVEFMTEIFSTVANLPAMLEACATRSLGFTSTFQFKPIKRTRKIRMAAFGSTPGGTSLQPILDALPASLGDVCELVIVIADKENAGVLRRATQLGYNTQFISSKGKVRTAFDAEVTTELKKRGVDLIVLVGYMRILSNEFCVEWKDRILNVHPSLLPDFAGGMDLQVHSAVIEAKKTISGCTVHLVTEVVDGGPIVLQKSCPVYPETDTPETLKARVQALEGPCLIESIENFAKSTGYFRKEERLTYESAGVSILKGDELVERIKNFCRATRRLGCDPELGGFGACFDLHRLNYEDPIFVSGTDGVGTKLLLAQELNEHGTIGIDLVAMSVNDLIVQGAEPMFFLDYFASGKLEIETTAKVVAGIARGCEISGCALIGGETAELPGMYDKDKYDLAGFAFGVVERKNLLPRQINEGDILIGLKSSGIHSNGYSLVRKIFKGMDLKSAATPFVSTKPNLKDILLEPTKIYYKDLKKCLKLGLIEGLSHITGSGLPGNLPRCYDPTLLSAQVDLSSWKPDPIFAYMAQRVDLKEMLSTFNCGIGMVLFVKPENVQKVLDSLPFDDEAFVIGKMIPKSTEEVVFIGDSFGMGSVSDGLTYSSAGVDIVAGDNFVENIKPFCKATRRSGCNADLGGFGALFDLKMVGQYEEPVVVSGTDGVGTKLILAQEFGKHDTVGIDLVAMSVNDLIVQGAEPLFFLDYFACGKLHIDVATEVVKGIAKGCEESGCALSGGETAEMPGMYSPNEYDLAGFAVGIVERKRLLPKKTMAGDYLIGVKSSGVHSNGFSLVRKVVEKSGISLESPSPFAPDKNLGESLLTPTIIYWKLLKPLLDLDLIESMSHITGSGIPGNLPRVFSDDLYAHVDLSSWKPSPVFQWIQSVGNIDVMEMLNTYNCGLGMVLIIRGKENVDKVTELLGDASVGVIGTLKQKKQEEPVVFLNKDVFF